MLVFVTLFCVLGFINGAVHKLPASFPRCQKKDPKLDLCLKKALETVMPELFVKGVPSLGMFPIEPLFVTALDIGNPTNPGSVSISLKFRDLDIKGLSSLELIDVKSDLNNYKMFFQAELHAPLILDGKYSADGRVLILPVKGAGKSHLKLDNVKASLTLTGREKKVKGVKYMDVKDAKLEFETTKLTLNFENLLGNARDGAVGDSLNAFMNENWQDILKDLKPGVEEALGAVFKDIANRVFSRVPFDQIFL